MQAFWNMLLLFSTFIFLAYITYILVKLQHCTPLNELQSFIFSIFSAPHTFYCLYPVMHKYEQWGTQSQSMRGGLLQCEAVRTGWDKGGGGTLTLNTVYCWQHIHTECWFHVHPIINLSPSLSPPPCYNCAASETIVFTPQTRRESHQWPTGRQTNTHTVHSTEWILFHCVHTVSVMQFSVASFTSLKEKAEA